MSVDETGNVSVEMVPEPESLRTERPFQSRLLRFFKGDEFVCEHSGGVGTLDIEVENPCTKLEVLFCSSDRLLAVQQNAFGAGKLALQPISVQLLPGEPSHEEGGHDGALRTTFAGSHLGGREEP